MLLGVVAVEFERMLSSDSVSLPSAATMSRYRSRLDVGFMLITRLAHRSAGGRRQHVRYVLCDSSPPCHDWEIVEWANIACDDLPELASAVDALSNSRGGGAQDLDEATAEEHDQTITASVVHRIGVPSALGTRRAGLVHKLHALVHAMCLEIDPSDRNDFLNSVVVFAADFGVEHGLADIVLDEASLVDVMKNFSPGTYLGEEAMIVGCDAGQRPDALVDVSRHLFPNALSVPGALHQLHNLTKDMFGCLGEWVVRPWVGT